jgi:hypothetical protein
LHPALDIIGFSVVKNKVGCNIKVPLLEGIGVVRFGACNDRVETLEMLVLGMFVDPTGHLHNLGPELHTIQQLVWQFSL